MLPSSSTGTPSAEASRGPIDVLVSETVQRIADVIDSFELSIPSTKLGHDEQNGPAPEITHREMQPVPH
ncbi:hypothetical protein GT037_001212 [Alternaria burnsii]|uniref:Uncharacterized protein n=1 Tax=Alternaria burnsii TaxID=1187904 RepID=A0A8H7EJC3_9PLEO|nr:uncharacterized protein GT037_001212 [Alternaria burnsii]KAF7682236.1 hypothetical protein GT037_001212 [Alternaria burnsii]